jgi:hypothetical protein
VSISYVAAPGPRSPSLPLRRLSSSPTLAARLGWGPGVNFSSHARFPALSPVRKRNPLCHKHIGAIKTIGQTPIDHLKRLKIAYPPGFVAQRAAQREFLSHRGGDQR